MSTKTTTQYAWISAGVCPAELDTNETREYRRVSLYFSQGFPCIFHKGFLVFFTRVSLYFSQGWLEIKSG